MSNSNSLSDIREGKARDVNIDNLSSSIDKLAPLNEQIINMGKQMQKQHESMKSGTDSDLRRQRDSTFHPDKGSIDTSEVEVEVVMTDPVIAPDIPIPQSVFIPEPSVEMSPKNLSEEVMRIRAELQDMKDEESDSPVTIPDFSAKKKEKTYKFGATKNANTSCAIRGGSVIYGQTRMSTTATTITFEGNPEIIFVQVDAIGSILGGVKIDHASVLPTNSTDILYLPLITYTATNGVYDDGDIHHEGDFVLLSPTA